MIEKLYICSRKQTSRDVCNALHKAQGFPITKEQYQGGTWVGFGAPDLWDGLIQCIKDRNDFYYIDHAYFGRGKYYRFTKNAFQHNGVGTPNYNRLKKFYESAKPWKKTGRNIIVCPQTTDHHKRFGDKDWLEKTVECIRKYTDRNIIVRLKGDNKSLYEDLENAYCLVTHSSNAAVEALMEGIPTICTGDCAAASLSLRSPSSVEKPWYPDIDRLEWAAVLAANQFTIEEFANGYAWEQVNKN